MLRHRLLVRQIRKYLGPEPALAPESQHLLAAVQEAYDQFDNDRRLTQRAMDLSSDELVLNLVVNGMDAMSTVEEEQRLLIIRGRRDIHDGKPAVTISVEDFGIGLKAEEMDHIFEPFYTTKPHGMGVGLPISRSIIEAHGGRLWAEPKAGSGATFLFSLPAADQTAS